MGPKKLSRTVTHLLLITDLIVGPALVIRANMGMKGGSESRGVCHLVIVPRCCLRLVTFSASPALGVGANKGMQQKEMAELKQDIHPLARGQGFMSGTENRWQFMAMTEVL